MIEASGLATLMLASLAQATLVAGAAWLALRDPAAGAARQRLRFATIAFYGAALLPLATRLPHELSLTVGPDAASLATLRAPLLGNAGDVIDALSFIALAIVALVVVVRLGRTIVAAVRGEKLVRTACALPPEDFGLPRHVRIARSDAVQGPCVAGLFKPTILLPARLEHAPRQDLALLLRHELHHLRRNDVRNTLLQRLVEDLYWWNPAMRCLGRWLNEQREMTCDEMGDDARAYAGALIGEARMRLTPGALAASASGSNVERRIERLIAPQPASALLSALVLAMLLVSLGAATTPRASNTSATHIGIDAS